MKFAQVGHCQDGVRQGEAAERKVHLVQAIAYARLVAVVLRPDAAALADLVARSMQRRISPLKLYDVGRLRTQVQTNLADNYNVTAPLVS